MRRRIPRAGSMLAGAATSALLVSFASVRVASAQEVAAGFALDRFHPSAGGSDWLTLESLDFRGTGRASGGLVLDFAHKPLVLYEVDGAERAAIVENQAFAHLGLSVNLVSRLRLAASLPVAFFQPGNESIVDTLTYAAPTGAGLGDLRLTADVLLWGAFDGPFRIGVGSHVFVPTGKSANYTGDGAIRVAPRLLVAGDAGPLVYAFRAGYTYRREIDAAFFQDTPVGSELDGALALGVRVAPIALVGVELMGGTSLVNSGALFKNRTTPLELIAGAHFVVMKDWHIGVGVAPGLSQALGTPMVRGLLSLAFFPHVETDRDHDGILDKDDACPDEPGVRTDDPATNGCPPDRDKDGILDKDDACPDEPGVKSDDPAKNGCPLPPDRDKDGIVDTDDACPDVAGVKTDNPKTNGCPDTDGDGIHDPLDACPKDPGPPNEDPTKNGCPLAKVEKRQIKILEQVKFKFNSAEILAESDALMNAIAKILTDHPEITKVRVEGHTDNRGGAKYNQKLSERRAASVVKWLVDRGGIDPSRLLSRGFGLTKPIGSNKTTEGRAQNRRSEFHIVEPKADDAGAVEEPAAPPGGATP